MNRATLISRPENSDEFRRRMLNLIVAVAVVLLSVVVVGCSDDDGNGGSADVEERDRGAGNQTLGERDTAGAGAEMQGSSTMGGASMERQTIAVTLKEKEISMPTILKPGPTTFNVVNAAGDEHSLKIEGNGQDLALGTDVEPGKAVAMEADLLPGTYRVYCPLDDHASDGASLQVTVQP